MLLTLALGVGIVSGPLTSPTAWERRSFQGSPPMSTATRPGQLTPTGIAWKSAGSTTEPIFGGAVPSTSNAPVGGVAAPRGGRHDSHLHVGPLALLFSPQPAPPVALPDLGRAADPVSCNYFAVTTRTFLQDAKRRFSVMTDRTQGGSSLAAGQLELMLHRRLASGCRWGMCEQDQYGMEKAGLNDTLGAEVVIKHLVSIDDVAGGSSTSLARMQSRGLNHPAALLFGSTSSATAWPDTARASPDVELPPNVELTTWETLNETATLVRLSHMFSPKEHPTWSQPATVDLCRLVARSCDAAVLTVRPSRRRRPARTDGMPRSPPLPSRSRCTRNGVSDTILVAAPDTGNDSSRRCPRDQHPEVDLAHCRRARCSYGRKSHPVWSEPLGDADAR